jgi:hypothetical protein
MVVRVDNREGPARTLAAGGFTYAVPANAVSAIPVQIPTCAAAARLTLDGEELGTLPNPESDEHFSLHDAVERDVWVDPTGKHCYDVTTAQYSSSAGSGYGPNTESLHGKKFYDVQTEITNVLQPVPTSIKSIGGVGSRTSIEEKPCPRP